MDGEQVWQAVERERLAFADLLESLAPHEWEVPSLCKGWRVRDVAAHVAMAPIIGPLSPLRDVIRAGGNFNKMAYQTAKRRSDAPPAELVARVRAMAGSRRMAFTMKPEEALLDVINHGQDVALPLGRVHPMRPEPCRIAAERVWAMTFPFFARWKLRGFRLVATDVDFTRGDGLEVRGPMGSLLLLSTGRTSALDLLTGEGTEALGRRLSPSASSRGVPSDAAPPRRRSRPPARG